MFLMESELFKYFLLGNFLQGNIGGCKNLSLQMTSLCFWISLYFYYEFYLLRLETVIHFAKNVIMNNRIMAMYSYKSKLGVFYLVLVRRNMASGRDGWEYCNL